MKVTILRGLPGAGKSRWVDKLDASVAYTGTTRGIVAVSADDYFTDDDGRYAFDPAKITLAHAACFKQYLAELADGTATIPDDPANVVIVDNTNVSNAEMAPYILAAQAYGVEDISIMHVWPPSIETCARRNVHGVPAEVIAGMAARWEQPLPYYPPTRIVWPLDE